MPTEVSSTIRAQYMADRRKHDAISHAIKVARTNGCSDKDVKPLKLAKQEYKDAIAKNNEKILNAMSLSQNTVQLEDSWYAVRYYDDKQDARLYIDLITDVSLLKRDERYERGLNRRDIDTLMPALIDEVAIEVYKHQLETKSLDIIYDKTGMHVEMDSKEAEKEVDIEELPVNVSVHAGLRWVQRVIGIKPEAQAEEYRKSHIEEVNEAVLDGFGTAEHVWTDNDGITYWFDADNIMYVKGSHLGRPTIITLYEEEFGFTKDINRIITLKQLDVLAETRNDLTDAEAIANDKSLQIDADVQAINDEIASLSAQLELLSAKKTSLIADKDVNNKQARAIKERYNAEYNKLFKKWEA